MSEVITNKTTICEQCGKPFTQAWKPAIGEFAKFKICGKCKLGNLGVYGKATEKQQEIVNSNARIKLIMGGMRSGKTVTLIACVEKAMRELGSRDTKALIHVPSERLKKQLFRDLKNQISHEIVLEFNLTDMVTTTTYGTIEIETFNDFLTKDGFDTLEIERELLKCDIVASDSSTCSSLFETIINTPCNNIIAAGHCPMDNENSFYKSWSSSYYGDIPDTKAFRMSTWDNPAMAPKREKFENQLISSMGLNKYTIQYLATFVK